MRSFIDKIAEGNYENIGFDLDGTLYDEFDFIRQAYLPVSALLADILRISKDQLYDALCNEWLRYGSSANIFQNVIYRYSTSIESALITRCVEEFRTANLDLSLSFRGKRTLDYLKTNGYKLFVVSDGNSMLQRRKMDSLRISSWINEKNIAVSGDFGKEAQKPNTIMAEQLGLLNENSGLTIFFGDRDCDYQFAKNCGFEFCFMKNMNIMEA